MSFNRVLLALCVAVLVARSTCAENVAASKPNVLMILVDDLKPLLGCYGNQVVRSPNIDRLASLGLRFDLAYCNQAVCAPSRFNLMLGSRSTSTGLYGLHQNLRDDVPDAVTLPQFFHRHGYQTHSLGKVFHVGHGNQGDPTSFSEPPFKDKVVEYRLQDSTHGQLTREEAFFENADVPNVYALPRGAAWESAEAEDTDYADGRVAEEAKRRLQQLAAGTGQPFFMAVGFARPHLPFTPPKKYWDLYDPATLPMPTFTQAPTDAPPFAVKRGGEITNYFPCQNTIDDSMTRQLIHGYYASVSYVDAQIGKVIDELQRLNLDQNTIVVLWGDHGFYLGEHGSWTKHCNFEQATRIPMVFVAPGCTQAQTSTLQLAETVDIYPTLAELAGLPTPAGPQPIDGVSLVPVLRNPEKRVRDHAYHAWPAGQHGIGRAIRTERFRLVEWKKVTDPPESAVLELYDFQGDALERENLAAARPDVVAQLREILDRHPAALPQNRPPIRK